MMSKYQKRRAVFSDNEDEDYSVPKRKISEKEEEIEDSEEDGSIFEENTGENDKSPDNSRDCEAVQGIHSEDISGDSDVDKIEDTKSEIDKNSSEESEEKSSNHEEEDSDLDDEEEDEEENYVKLNKEQTSAFKYIEKLLRDKAFKKTNPKIVIVDGPAGTGKTVLLKELSDFVRYDIKGEAICVASTGVAALNFDKGRTAHSTFNFPLDEKSIEDNEFCEINDYNQQVSGASIIIYDAINLADIRLIEMMNESLKKLMRTNENFGGKVVVFGADFLGLGPIASGEGCSLSVRFSTLFNKTSTKTFFFKKPHRTLRDTEHFRFITQLGSGNLPGEQLSSGDLPKYLVPITDINHTTDINELIEYVYPDGVLQDSNLCTKRVILAPSLSEVLSINSIISESIDSEQKKLCPSIDNIMDYTIFNRRMEELGRSQEDKVFPEKNLILWVGCICMMIRTNYRWRTTSGGYQTLLTGAKVIVTKILRDTIYVRKPGNQEGIMIERNEFSIKIKNKIHERYQFPLRLCYATTIHKSQGLTLDKVGVDLRKSVFCHGQLYVALSRVRNSEDLKICISEEHDREGVAHAVNVVDRRMVIKNYL